MSEAFEKASALLFLFLLVGLVLFLTYIPLPAASEKAVLMIIGGLMALCTQALPKLFGSSREKRMAKKIQKLEHQLEVVQEHHTQLVRLLVERHVIDKQGLIE